MFTSIPLAAVGHPDTPRVSGLPAGIVGREMGSDRFASPDVNVGPNTGFAGNGRERPWVWDWRRVGLFQSDSSGFPPEAVLV